LSLFLNTFLVIVMLVSGSGLVGKIISSHVT